MTEELFRQDAYLEACEARVVAVTEAGIVLDRTVFYPLGGGQAGDAGVLVLADGRELAIADTRTCKDPEGRPTNDIAHVPAAGQEAAVASLRPGDAVTARVDWERRHKLMRFHTTTHLLCHLVPELVNGCSITPDYARLDFNMTDPLDKDLLTRGIARTQLREEVLLAGLRHVRDLPGGLALVVLGLAGIGDLERAAVGEHQHAGVAGLAPTERVEHRAIEQHALVADGDDGGGRLPQVGILPKQLLGHGTGLSPFPISPSAAGMAAV